VKFLSVCSGIEAASVAWSPLGWKAVAFSEIEPFPCAVLAHHYPDTPNWGDMTKYKEWPDVSIDLLCGGTPCQSFSVAGLRKGLDDPRGDLMLTFGAIAAKYRPKWLVWENVPGVLSSNGGRDFGSFLGLLGVLGYGFAYRVLDAQYFGVAQRRRRVFVVGCLGDWRSAAAVLFERHSLSGHPAPRRQAGKVAPTIPARSTAGGGLGTDFDCDGGLQVAGTMKACKDSGGWSNSADHAAAGYMVPVGTICVATGQAGAEIGADMGADMAPTLNCNHEAPYVAHSLRGEGFDASEDGTGRGTPLVPMFLHTNKGRPDGRRSAHTEMVSVKDIVETLTTDGHARSAVAVPVAFAENSRHELRLEGGDGQRTGALSTGGGKPGQGVPMIAFPANLSGTQCASTENLSPSLGAKNPTAVAVALRGREGGATAELGDEVQNCLRASSGGGDKPHVLCETLYNKGFNHGGIYASTQETHAGKILRTLREAVGEEAFAQWGLGILGSLQSPEILRQALHGLSIRPAAFSRSWVVHCALSRSENGSGWLLQSLREAGCERCASQGWEPSEQLAGKLGAYLSELSQPGAQASRFVRDLWWAAQGPGLLREALSAVQEVGRPTHGQSQPAHGGMQVRRLTVEECEFLQGFPRSYTAVPHRGKPAADGPRYKALGNSWAVPNVRWLGERINAVQAVKDARKKAA
jgi:DNA (cytosine-5)-methyltransferase 1